MTGQVTSRDRTGTCGTGAWYAVADRSDRHHAAAGLYLDRATARDLVTSDVIASETLALLAAHLGWPAAQTFWATLRELQVPILTLDPVDLEVAWRIAQAFPDQDFSFTDCASFAVMERRGIEDVFAFDAHFLVYRYGADRRRAFRRHPV